jgi:hypothetical protein
MLQRVEVRNQGMPHIEWRAWNKERTRYTAFKSRAAARDYIRRFIANNVKQDLPQVS